MLPFCVKGLEVQENDLSINYSSGHDEDQPLVTAYKCPTVVWTVNPSVMNTLYVVPGIDRGSERALMAFAVKRFG